MISLAIDTSAAASVALVAGDGTVLAEATEFGARKHVEHVGPALTEVCVGHAAPERVLVGVGPGPFTGLRAGIAAGIGFAVARGLPVFGVRSHDALAFACRGAGIGGELLVATDARRKEVYWSHYRVTSAAQVPAEFGAAAQVPAEFGAAAQSGAPAKNAATAAGITSESADLPHVELVAGPAVDTPAALAEYIVRENLIGATRVGRGFDIYADVLGGPSLAGDEFAEPQARCLARAALTVRADDLLPVAPLYLREPDAKPLPGR